MALTQTRRSISVRGVTYDSLRRYCDQNDRSMSDVVEELLATLLGKAKPIHARTGSTVVKAVVKAAEPVVKPAVKPPVAKAAAKPMVKPATSVKTAPKPPIAAKTVKASVAKAPEPVAAASGTKTGTVGRPAPTAAAVALSNTRRASGPKGDYRGIRF